MGKLATIGEKLARLRAERGWTLKELAERSGVSLSHISAIENETRPNPSIGRMQKIARALGVSLAYFDDDPPAPAPGVPNTVPAPPSTLELAQQLQRLYDPDTQRFIASEASRPYVSLARQLANPECQHDPSGILQVIAQFMRDHKTPYTSEPYPPTADSPHPPRREA
ncbi:MAG: helix-turn-helix domain-containing protein [Alicyclobacillus sp.]|nr:helix-turn-helix domain-containing protein [Alicyclobacillus sp.]